MWNHCASEAVFPTPRDWFSDNAKMSLWPTGASKTHTFFSHRNADVSIRPVHISDQIPGIPLCSLSVSAGLWTLIPAALFCDVSQFFWGTIGRCQHAPHRCHRRNERVSRSKIAPVYWWPFLQLAVHFSKKQEWELWTPIISHTATFCRDCWVGKTCRWVI